MKIEDIAVEQLAPYERNNRKHPEQQVKRIGESIKRYGFIQPLVIDANNVLVIGHGRLLAAQHIGLESVPCVRLEGLSEQEIKALRILDNKLQNDSEWHYDNLQLEITELDADGFDLDEWGLEDLLLTAGDDNLQSENEYTTKVDSPVYEITGPKPRLSDLYDTTKRDLLVSEIESADIPEKEKDFLIAAANRHVVFNYEKIAEYYAHSSKELQKQFEASALIIIDYQEAIAQGFVKLVEQLSDQYESENE
jgi:hypothetical protein